jgi:hypothetical protein
MDPRQATGARQGGNEETDMNTRAKIAAGVAAGLIAGAALMGAAFAAPRALNAPIFNGYGMMGSLGTSSTAAGPTIGQMQTFMDQYRTPSGGIDMNRMRSDIASGKVTPPCLTGRTQGADSPGTGAGYGMMGRGY